MKNSPPTIAELKQHFNDRAIFLQTMRDAELREISAIDAVANILAMDGFVAMTASTQLEREDSGMREQQRLFRLMRLATHG